MKCNGRSLKQWVTWMHYKEYRKTIDDMRMMVEENCKKTLNE